MPLNKEQIAALNSEVQEQSKAILAYWVTYSQDPRDNGFYGAVDNDNRPVLAAIKGSVLNARILWSFATGYQYTQDPSHLQLADRAFAFYLRHFKDLEYGGVFWSIQAPNTQLTTDTTDRTGHKKQIYAQAFWVYALSAYYKVTQKPEVLQETIGLFRFIERYSFDPMEEGYFEAFAKDWSSIPDVRLSEKDSPAVKTTNTHLHILEAYAGLYQVWPDAGLKKQIRHLLHCFDKYIIDPDTHHLRLYFDARFQSREKIISYGHDIEASWLLLEAAKTIQDAYYIPRMEAHCRALVDGALEGLDTSTGGLIYESIPLQDSSGVQLRTITEKHWWVQAEALVGLLTAYLLTNDEHYFHLASSIWEYICQHILSETGEWCWGIDPAGQPMTGYDKIGFWKCPYHNLRAMMEAAKRLAVIH